MTIDFIVFLIADVLLSIFSVGARFCFRLGHRMRNIGISVFLLTTLVVQSAVIYFVATKFVFLTIVLLIVFYIYWFLFAPYYTNADPAGNAMAQGFHFIFCVVGLSAEGLADTLFGALRDGLFDYNHSTLHTATLNEAQLQKKFNLVEEYKCAARGNLLAEVYR